MDSGSDTRSVPFLYPPSWTPFQGGSRMKIRRFIIVYKIVQECSSFNYECNQDNEYFKLSAPLKYQVTLVFLDTHLTPLQAPPLKVHTDN